MPKYEALPITTIQAHTVQLETQQLPELVYLEDSARVVMIDFTKTPPQVISPEASMDKAIQEMEITGAHQLLVMDHEGFLEGIITSEDVLGEKPIQLIQERRIHRDQVTVKMIMVPRTQILAIDYALLKNACVGHIVKTLAEHHKQYALVVCPTSDAHLKIRGIFMRSQMSKQLHMNLA